MERIFVCGTRAVIERDVRYQRGRRTTYRVVCATCNGGGSYKFVTKDAATKVAVRDSGKPCPVKCGAE
jgi:hypothetical protein